MALDHRLRRVGVLSLGLAIHAGFVLVYLALVVAIADVASQIGDLTTAAFTAALPFYWLFFFGGSVWLIVLVNLIRWWRQGRTRLVSSTVAWDLLLWLGPFLALLVRWDLARTLLVPSPTPLSYSDNTEAEFDRARRAWASREPGPS
jgi:hypothetical protein